MKREQNSTERGAALIAVLFISILLVTACAFLLSAVGHNSRNSSDVLAETKAYYAAESGLQATINVFRNELDPVTYPNPYRHVVENDPTLAGQLTYEDVNGRNQVKVGANAGFTVSVTDPDNSGVSTTFSVDGEFQQADGFTYAATRVFGSGADTTTISYAGIGTTTATHPMTTGVSFGNFQIVSTGNGAPLENVRFRINYRMQSPRAAVRSFIGEIDAATRTATIAANDYDNDGDNDDFVFSLMGQNNIFLCSSDLCNSTAAFQIILPAPTTVPQTSTPTLYGKMLPVEPYRLRLLVTGYARPGNAKKQLEAVIQRNLFNGLGSSAAISMVGPNAYFNVGTSAQMNIDGASNPSITVSDAAGLATVLGDHTNGTIQPPPQIAGPDLPEWQQSTFAMDAFINQLRQAAENSGRIFTNTSPSNFGDFASGQGITFCDGSCTMGGNAEGGGILVVTGTFYTSGNPKFNGIVIAIGRYVDATNPGGVVRGGGGNELFTGTIVIAPYDPDNLAAGFEQPRYDQSGGPGDTVNSAVDVDVAVDGTQAITDFILGIAEK